MSDMTITEVTTTYAGGFYPGKGKSGHSGRKLMQDKPADDESTLQHHVPSGRKLLATPTSIDWRSYGGKNYVSPVKSQASCSMSFYPTAKSCKSHHCCASTVFSFSKNNAISISWLVLLTGDLRSVLCVCLPGSNGERFHIPKRSHQGHRLIGAAICRLRSLQGCGEV